MVLSLDKHTPLKGVLKEVDSNLGHFQKGMEQPVADLVFTTPAWNQVSWGAGTVYFPNGEQQSISGNSLTLSTDSLYYLYVVDGNSEIQNSVTYSDAVGLDRFLVATAKRSASGNTDERPAVMVYVGTGMSVNSDTLGPESVTTVKIGDAQVSTVKLQDGSVTTLKIGSLAVDAAKLADGAVTITKHASGLRPVEIVGSLPSPGSQGRTVFLTTDSKLYRDTGTSWTAAVPTADLTGQITETQVSDGAISTPKLQANAVTAAKIAAGTITANEIAANTITAGNIAAGAINTDELAADAVTSGKIAAGAVLAAQIAAGAVVTDKLAAGAVAADKLTANQITGKDFRTAANVGDGGGPAGIRFDASGIVGYSGGTTKQFELKASNGKLEAGGGNVVLDAAGIQLLGASQLLTFRSTVNGTVDGFLARDFGEIRLGSLSGYNLTLVAGADLLLSAGNSLVKPGSATMKLADKAGTPWLELAVKEIFLPATRRLNPYSDSQVAVEFVTETMDGSLGRDHKFRPSKAGWGYVGDDTNWWYKMYSQWFYGKNTTIQSFDTEPDIDLVMAIQSREHVDEKTGQRTMIFDPDTFPAQVKSEDGQFVNMGAFIGLLLGTIRQLSGKVRGLEALPRP